jgi:predicted DNA-binding transcriptional regulator YafY
MDQPKIERLLRLIMLMAGKTDYTVEDIAYRLAITPRSVYRYIDTLRACRFVIEKKRSNLYKLVKIPETSVDFNKLIYFTEEEAYIMNSLINALDGSNSIKANLQQKLSAIYRLTSLTELTVSKKNAQNVELLGNAIRGRKTVILKAYESANSETVSDRIVEPFAFTTNYIDIWAYDLNKKKNRIYKISRIESIEILDESWANESLHNKNTTDCFRMSGEESVPIRLGLSLRAKNLLLEEYPLTAKYLTQTEKSWILETLVQDLAGVGRFVIGLAGEIRIIDSPELEQYVREYTQQHLTPYITESET